MTTNYINNVYSIDNLSLVSSTIVGGTRCLFLNSSVAGWSKVTDDAYNNALIVGTTGAVSTSPGVAWSEHSHTVTFNNHVHTFSGVHTHTTYHVNSASESSHKPDTWFEGAVGVAKDGALNNMGEYLIFDISGNGTHDVYMGYYTGVAGSPVYFTIPSTLDNLGAPQTSVAAKTFSPTISQVGTSFKHFTVSVYEKDVYDFSVVRGFNIHNTSVIPVATIPNGAIMIFCQDSPSGSWVKLTEDIYNNALIVGTTSGSSENSGSEFLSHTHSFNSSHQHSYTHWHAEELTNKSSVIAKNYYPDGGDNRYVNVYKSTTTTPSAFDGALYIERWSGSSTDKPAFQITSRTGSSNPTIGTPSNSGTSDSGGSATATGAPSGIKYHTQIVAKYQP